MAPRIPVAACGAGAATGDGDGDGKHAPRATAVRVGARNGLTPRRAGPLPCLACLAAGIAGCAGNAGDAVDDDAITRGADPGYSASDARIVETGPDGRPRYTLDAATIRQDPRSLEVNLERLSMVVAEGDAAAPWTLTAEGGRMPEDASRIDLLGDVRVAGSVGGEPGAAAAEPIEIRSEALSYEFGPARVTSDTDVSVRLTGKWLQARGLEANLKERQVRLESKVHGRFVP
ncbi:MAG: LPS export ABC transporter periplasmic protein LptC [Steroidobacteraceae bacterium]|nr:LPS export ABC transporter periplasmic protein LptC [Steroidobacteraceae bacterium]